LAGELADLTAFVFKLASQHGIDMNDVMHAHLAKFVARYGDIQESQREMDRYASYQERNLAWVVDGRDIQCSGDRG
jgi:hypothetical protein